MIQDELDFPLGTLRIHTRRSSAGHNGIESIIGALGTQDFLRIRIGVAPEHKVSDGQGYLLSPMRKAELAVVDGILDTAEEAVKVILKEGPAAAMNRFNRQRRLATDWRGFTRIKAFEDFGLSVSIREDQWPRIWERRMNRTYELMFIVRPDMTEEDLDKLIAMLQSIVPASGGSIVKVDKMGKRRLAYVVRRFHEGIYVLLVVEGGGAVVHELERRLRVTEQVIKFLTVRIDEEQKRLDKMKALRDARKKVSAQPAAAPAPVAAAAEAPAAAAPEAPATA